MAKKRVEPLPSIRGTGGIGGGSGTGNGGVGEVQLAQQVLGSISSSFSVTPGSLAQPGTVTVKWSYTLPTAPSYTITVKLDGEAVPASGSKSIQVTSATTIALVASTPVTEPPLKVPVSVTRVLGQQTVLVGAQTEMPLTLSMTLITEQIQNTLESAFSQDGKIQLNPKVSATHSANVIDIGIPATINVPDWFDGSLGMSAQINIGSGSTLAVTASQVNFSASWSTLSNILSLGNTSSAGDAMTELGQAMWEHIVDAEIVSALQDYLSGQISDFADSLKNDDPQGPTYTLYSLTYDAATDNLVITVVPGTR